MTVLSSLAKAYERMADAPPFGYSTEKIGFLIALNEDGSVAGAPIDLRVPNERNKPVARMMAVPQPPKRTSGIAPCFLWDKTAYTLGVTAGAGKRTAAEHAAFVEKHREVLAGTGDPGLQALLRFLETWSPEQFEILGWPEEMKDQNVIFALSSEYRQHIHLHDRPAARDLLAGRDAADDQDDAACLVTGDTGPIARLHPAIKGVWGAQTSGASIVSFNLDAFESYNHSDGDNAPVSEKAAFAYTTALNRFLEKASDHRLQVGDASTVFWAEAPDAETAQTAENVFLAALSDIDEKADARQVGVILDKIRQGLPLRDFAPELAEGVRFYVLGLAPNAARLSIRFWLEDDFGQIAGRYQKYVQDMRVEPGPRRPYPPLWRYLAETAALGKRENVPPNLAGEWMRAILTGAPYPLTLLATVLMRIRADKKINALRAGILKAVLIRNFNREKTPVALDPAFTDKGYLLGRLFAVYEHIQYTALGGNVNATIKDKYYGSAATQPRKVFTFLDTGSANHLSKIGKEKPGARINLTRYLEAITDLMTPDTDPYPTSLSTAEQAMFVLGYHHQHSAFFTSHKPDLAEKDTTQ